VTFPVKDLKKLLSIRSYFVQYSYFIDSHKGEKRLAKNVPLGRMFFAHFQPRAVNFCRAAGKDATPPADSGAVKAISQPINSSHIEKSLLASYPGVPTVLDDSQAWTRT
jgi:hypothetical protein